MKKNLVGGCVVIPAGEYWGVMKIIFQSKHTKNMICIKLYKRRISEKPHQIGHIFSGDYDIYYTSSNPIKDGRWELVGTEAVSHDEKEMTKRISGGNVWIEDTMTSIAPNIEIESVAKELVYGHRLIEKYSSRHPLLTN